MFPLCRNFTCQLKLGYLTKSWNVSSVASQYVNTDHLTRRKFSALSSHPSHLELKKCQNSPLYVANSKRNLEYNLFSNLIYVAQQQFNLANQFTGLDWWLTIILCSVPLRTAIAYFITVKKAEFDKHNRYITQAFLEPEISRIKRDIQGGNYRHLSAADKKKVHSKQMRISYRKICKEHNHNPWKLLIYGFAPLPYWAANSLALRKISGAPMPSWLGESGICICPDMTTGGMLWFTNLCEHDPYHVLSVITGLSFLFAIEVSSFFFQLL
ncbi:uncharacterized protein LOC132722089 [Ruditapes philippinarum]|uniref:uncharacterized protein LOC132722089 n=1 Tax=Ruditapes philippinarum TaxID=129788 RepID=UPI00295AC692|nr:uncharacterized protein LOC132722089 [Ruditapes philippinarum]